MASSKKSLVDKFTADIKQKSPGKRNRKSSKASKSLSRELTKAPASPGSSKRRAGKSGSDTLVALRKDSDDEASKETVEKDRGRKMGMVVQKDTSEPMEIEFEKPIHIEKLDTSLTANWSRPEGSVYSPVDASASETDLSVFGSPSPGSSISPRASIMPAADVKLQSESLTSPSPLQLLKLTSTSSVSSCPSSDSLASEMESYKLGSRSPSGSDVDTLKNSACEEINISECSSTSTPIKFGLFDNTSKDHTHLHMPLSRKAPPKFSLIREVATEDLDNLSLSSECSPTTSGTGFKSLSGQNRIDDYSDESDSSRMKESSEFSDDAETHSHVHFVPLNKQLQIVTSMDRMIDRQVYFFLHFFLHFRCQCFV